MSVPVLLDWIPCAPIAAPPVMFPITVAEAVPVSVAQGTDPVVTFAVSVTPLDSVNDPPAVAPEKASFRISPVLPRSVLTFNVIVNELATRTSPDANVCALAVPLGVVAQIDPFTFPLDLAK